MCKSIELLRTKERTLMEGSVVCGGPFSPIVHGKAYKERILNPRHPPAQRLSIRVPSHLLDWYIKSAERLGEREREGIKFPHSHLKRRFVFHLTPLSFFPSTTHRLTPTKRTAPPFARSLSAPINSLHHYLPHSFDTLHLSTLTLTPHFAALIHLLLYTTTSTRYASRTLSSSIHLSPSPTYPSLPRADS